MDPMGIIISPIRGVAAEHPQAVINWSLLVSLCCCPVLKRARIPGDSRSSAVKSSGKFGIWPMAIWNGDDEITKHLRLVDWLIGWFVGWWLDWMKRVYFLPKKNFLRYEKWDSIFVVTCQWEIHQNRRIFGYNITYLVGGLEHDWIMTFHILGIIIPTDSYFSEG